MKGKHISIPEARAISQREVSEYAPHILWRPRNQEYAVLLEQNEDNFPDNSKDKPHRSRK
jgi:hypothetical protein